MAFFYVEPGWSNPEVCQNLHYTNSISKSAFVQHYLAYKINQQCKMIYLQLASSDYTRNISGVRTPLSRTVTFHVKEEWQVWLDLAKQ
jgi:hypothetical protein